MNYESAHPIVSPFNRYQLAVHAKDTDQVHCCISFSFGSMNTDVLSLLNLFQAKTKTLRNFFLRK